MHDQADCRHWQDTITCMELLERGIHHMKAPRLTRYRDLLKAVRERVYAGVSPHNMTLTDPPTHSSLPGMVSVDNFDDLDQGAFGPIVFPQDDGLDAYVNEVTGLFDSGVLEMDEALVAWYGSVMSEVQPPRTDRLS